MISLQSGICNVHFNQIINTVKPLCVFDLMFMCVCVSSFVSPKSISAASHKQYTICVMPPSTCNSSKTCMTTHFIIRFVSDNWIRTFSIVFVCGSYVDSFVEHTTRIKCIHTIRMSERAQRMIKKNGLLINVFTLIR